MLKQDPSGQRSSRRESPVFLPGLSPVAGKPVQVTLDAGRLTSDGGILLLAEMSVISGSLSAWPAASRTPARPSALSTRSPNDPASGALLIAAGYEDGDDLDALRGDPAFKLACGRLPDSGADLCSQPTVSRWENAPTLREVVRMTYAMVDVYCRSYDRPPAAVTLDIDDTCDVAHGNQQMSLFHAHYDARCFLPIHVYDAANARPVAFVFLSGQDPRRGGDPRLICGVWYGGCVTTGPTPASRFAATATTAAAR